MVIRITTPLAMALVVVTTLILYAIFWHLPLDALGALQTPFQDERYSDPNFYLYAAAGLCKQATWSVEDLAVTWSSAGVVGFLALGCQFTGSEYFYVIANPLLIAASLAVFLHIAGLLGIRANIGVGSILALPYTWLTLSLPGKEIISLCGAVLVASGLLLATAGQRRWRAGLMIILGLVIVAVSRAHEAAAIAIFVVLWLSRSLFSVWRLLAILMLIAQVAPWLLAHLQLDTIADSLTDEALWSGSSEGKAQDYDALFDLLRSDNLIVHALLGFIRVLVIIAAPIASIVAPWTDADFNYFIFRDISQRLRVIDVAFILYTFTCLARTVPGNDNLDLTRERRMKWLLPAFFIFMAYVIVFFGVSQKSRYIFQYTPLLLLWRWIFNSSPSMPEHQVSGPVPRTPQSAN